MCYGVEIMLADFKTYRSFELALIIIDAYRKLNPDSLIGAHSISLIKGNSKPYGIKQGIAVSRR